MEKDLNQFTGKPRVWSQFFDTSSLGEVALNSFQKQFDAYENTPEGRAELEKIPESLGLIKSRGFDIEKVKAESTFLRESPAIHMHCEQGEFNVKYIFNPTNSSHITLNKDAEFIKHNFEGNHAIHHELTHLNHKDLILSSLNLTPIIDKQESIYKIGHAIGNNELIENPNEFEKQTLQEIAKFKSKPEKLSFLENKHIEYENAITAGEKSVRYESETLAVAAENIFLDEKHQRADSAYLMNIGHLDKGYIDNNNNNKLDPDEVTSFKKILLESKDYFTKLDSRFLDDAVKALDKIEMKFHGEKEKGSHVSPSHGSAPDDDTPSKHR